MEPQLLWLLHHETRQNPSSLSGFCQIFCHSDEKEANLTQLYPHLSELRWTSVFKGDECLLYRYSVFLNDEQNQGGARINKFLLHGWVLAFHLTTLSSETGVPGVTRFLENSSFSLRFLATWVQGLSCKWKTISMWIWISYRRLCEIR